MSFYYFIRLTSFIYMSFDSLTLPFISFICLTLSLSFLPPVLFFQFECLIVIRPLSNSKFVLYIVHYAQNQYQINKLISKSFYFYYYYLINYNLCRFKEEHYKFRICKLHLKAYQKTRLKDRRRLEISRQDTTIKFFILF